MQLMDDSIRQRLEEGMISPNEAYQKASDKSRFEHLLSGGGRKGRR
jgi:Tfp pilus assembly pilus retraction ATPase PilT